MTSSGQGLNNICVLYDTIYLLSRYKILVLTLINHSLLIFKPFIVFLGSFSLCTGNLKIVMFYYLETILEEMFWLVWPKSAKDISTKLFTKDDKGYPQRMRL